jgi:hypothetical protein
MGERAPRGDTCWELRRRRNRPPSGAVFHPAVTHKPPHTPQERQATLVTSADVDGRRRDLASPLIGRQPPTFAPLGLRWPTRPSMARGCVRGPVGPKWGHSRAMALPPSRAGADSVESGESPLQRRHDFCGGHQPSDWSPTCATRASRYAQPIRARRCRAARRTCRSARTGGRRLGRCRRRGRTRR